MIHPNKQLEEEVCRVMLSSSAAPELAGACSRWALLFSFFEVRKWNIVHLLLKWTNLVQLLLPLLVDMSIVNSVLKFHSFVETIISHSWRKLTLRRTFSLVKCKWKQTIKVWFFLLKRDWTGRRKPIALTAYWPDVAVFPPQGTMCRDCVLSTFCPACSWCQMSREMKQRKIPIVMVAAKHT